MSSRSLVGTTLRHPTALCLALLTLFFPFSTAVARSQTASTASGVPAIVPSIKDAATALAAGDLKRAENELQAILQVAPKDVHALNLLAIVRAEQKRNAEAEALFKQAIAIQPDFAGPHAGLGLLYAQLGENDLAIAPLQAALKLDPGRKDVQAVLISIRRRQAHDAAEHNELEKALALLIDARKLNPADADVQYEFGIVALRMSLFPDAIDAFHQTLKFRADDAAALYGLGRAEMSVSRFDNAQQAFERYVHLRPADASARYALGFTLQALQRAPDARAEYEKSIALQPLQTESYFQLGLMALEAGDPEAAAKQFEHVLERAPRHAGGLTGMGRVKFQEKQYAEAAALFEKAIAANPGLREAHYYLGLTDSRLGRKEDSEKELQIASRIEHEEVEKHQTLLKIIDPDQARAAETEPNQ
jgi:tetratricopeptide (TPR) repeat protein